MEKLEQVLFQSWRNSPGDDDFDWEDNLIFLGCGFIRNVRITDHLGWPIKIKKPGFVLVRHPNPHTDGKHCDYCLIPESLALKIMALEYLPIHGA